MFKHGDISTEIGKGPFIFTVCSCVITTVTAILILIKGHGDMLGIMAAVMLLIVAVASFGVLVGLISDYAYIKDDVLHMSYVLKKGSIPLRDIGKIELRKDVYHVFDKKDEEVGTINGLALGIDKITGELYRKNVPFR